MALSLTPYDIDRFGAFYRALALGKPIC